MLCCRLVACEICRVLFLVDAVSAFLVLVMLGSLIFLQFTNGYHILFIMIHHHNVGCKILLIVCYLSSLMYCLVGLYILIIRKAHRDANFHVSIFLSRALSKNGR